MSGSGARRLALLLAAVAPLGCGDLGRGSNYDLVLTGGRVVDGVGTRPYVADVAIRAGRIAAIGRLDPREAGRRIDVTGLVVAPGFIDMHSHADLILLAPIAVQSELLEAKVRQGVTTVVVGNCGLGVAPAGVATAGILAAVNGWMTPRGVSAGPLGLADYLDRIERGGTVVNAGTLVPHGPVRVEVLGVAAGEPSAAQLDRMRIEVDRGLAAGGFGLSVGLIYPPGMYAATDELIELARVVARHDRLFTAHVRGASETLLDATSELVEIARRSGARVHHSHMEAVGEAFWAETKRMIAIEDRARADGWRISHDVFPYTRAATMMTAVFPPWALEGGVDSLLERLREPRLRERMRAEIETLRPGWPPWTRDGWSHNLVGAVGWDGIFVASVGSRDPHAPIGRTVAEIAGATGRRPFDVVVELLLDEHGAVGQQVAEISGRDGAIEALLAILEHPAAAIVSDAEDFGGGAPHPAHAGAFVRALRLNRELRLMPIEEIVRRMTGHPAGLLGIGDRGRIEVGLAADLVAFDPLRVTDRASWDEPQRHAEGVELVLINGVPVVEAGAYSGAAHGVVLRASDARLSSSSSPSTVSASTAAMRREAVPSP
ncbi:MAG TPA: amidohydrolase family protein [Candidatus Polarisedimenticolaceae bacterium]|nr:amidohydrolase family protein [Candidatus Polarisedimenticolaceae bacterium]